jgi:hypothetical protein
MLLMTTFEVGVAGAVAAFKPVEDLERSPAEARLQRSGCGVQRPGTLC